MITAHFASTLLELLPYLDGDFVLALMLLALMAGGGLGLLSLVVMGIEVVREEW